MTNPAALEACRKICELLAGEALLRIDSNLREADLTTTRRLWLLEQRDALTQALAELRAP